MTALQFLTDSPTIDRFGWTLVHSLWQIAIVAGLLALALPAFVKRGARAGYAACCGALLSAVVLPVFTFIILVASPARSSAVNDSASSGPKSAQEKPAVVQKPAAAAIASSDRSLTASRTPAFAPQGDQSPATDASRNVPPRDAGIRARATPLISAWPKWIVLGWSVGALGLSLWNVGAWLAVQRLKRNAIGPVPAAIGASAARIARDLGLVRAVRLLQSRLVDSPVVIGAMKPVILLPASLVTGIPADQLETLLAHELAHVLRHDYLVNLAQSAVETVLFYHPAVWWISSQVRAQREHCCDDIAVQFAGDRTVYVKALAACAIAHQASLAPAATGGLLLARLRRLLQIRDSRPAPASGWLAGGVLFCVGALAIAGYVVRSRPAAAEVNPAKPSAIKRERSRNETSAASSSTSPAFR